MLRGMFGDGCLSKSGTVGRVMGKEELEGLSKEELVRRMVELQIKGLGDDGGGELEHRGEGSVGSKRGFTEEWVCGQSRGVKWGGKNRGGAKAFDPEKVQW